MAHSHVPASFNQDKLLQNDAYKALTADQLDEIEKVQRALQKKRKVAAMLRNDEFQRRILKTLRRKFAQELKSKKADVDTAAEQKRHIAQHTIFSAKCSYTMDRKRKLVDVKDKWQSTMTASIMAKYTLYRRQQQQERQLAEQRQSLRSQELNRQRVQKDLRSSQLMMRRCDLNARRESSIQAEKTQVMMMDSEYVQGLRDLQQNAMRR